ncbi:MAG: serine/threonine protein kinase [Kofleriaceae bacterium]
MPRGDGMDSLHGASQQDPLIGQTIGNYLVKQKLGEGGMGAVYLAEHPGIGKKVALKVLHSEFSGNAEIAERFFNEAKAVNNIGHPNIVDILDYGIIQSSHGQLMYFFMEYLSGQSLSALLRNEGPIPPERALGIALQVADALAASHKCGIVHRDLKPDNIMLQARGRERDVVKLLDFGIAKLTGDAASGTGSRTRAGIVMGTPAYMSPEQCEGKSSSIDLRTDVYALGIVLYEMMVGRVPFIGEGYGEILVQHMTQNPAPPSSFRLIPPHVEAVILKALQKRPELRFPSMDEMMRAMADPVGYVEANGGIQNFATTQLMPSNAAFTPPVRPSSVSSTYGTPPPGSLTPPSGIYGPGSYPGTPTPTTLGASAGQVTGGGRGKIGFIIAALLILGGAGAAIAVVAGKKSNNTVAAGSGSDEKAIPDAGAEKTVAMDAAVVAVTPDAAPVTPDAAVAAMPDAAVVEPTMSTITIVTKPAGAAIYVDGKDTGKKTPEPFTVDKNKKLVTIDLRLTTFETMTLKKFSVEADANVDYTLKPKKQGPKNPPNGTGKGSNAGSGSKTGNDTGLERPE